MGQFDAYARTGDPEGAAKMAKALGWDGLCLVTQWKGKDSLEGFKGSIRPLRGLDIAVGVEIDSGKVKDFRKVVRSVRKGVELVLVSGGDPEKNRAVLETPEVDALVRPWAERNCGLDYVMARIARKNNVAVQFDFSGLLMSNKRTRVGVMARFLEAAKLVRKYSSPFVLTSGAMDPYDIRAPADLVSFGRVLGFRDPAIKVAMSDTILKENRKRLSGKWIMPGVELE
jgi:ribonuclease P/MRP protein subunit RPP1